MISSILIRCRIVSCMLVSVKLVVMISMVVMSGVRVCVVWCGDCSVISSSMVIVVNFVSDSWMFLCM